MRLFKSETDQEWSERYHREHRWDQLARYNAEVSRGLVHTPEYVERMRLEQEAFNAERRAEWEAEPRVVILR
jgi:hypothetical protein